MPAPQPPVSWLESPAPQKSPIAQWKRSHTSLTLGLPELGSIRVSADGIEVLAESEINAEATYTRLGEWARAQWFIRHGFMVLRGAAIARDGQVVILAGTPRCGASVLAYVMSRNGWGLISDGLTVIDPQGNALSTSPQVIIDVDAGQALPPEVTRTYPPSGRERMVLEATGHGDAAVSAFVLLRVRAGLTRLVFDEIADIEKARDAVLQLTIHGQIPGTSSGFSLPDWHTWRLTRPIASNPHMQEEFTPPAIARLLSASFAGETDSQEVPL